MNFLKKIKYNYNLKRLEDLIKNKDNKELNAIIIEKFHNDITLLKTIFQLKEKQLIDINSDQNLDNKKIIWINGYLDNDTEFLQNFLKFYFQKVKFDSIEFIPYRNFIFDINERLEIKKMKFEEYISNANFYQYCLKNIYSNKKYSFVQNSIPFYETADKKMFTHPNLSSCYFYVVRHPFEILTILKNQTENLDLSINQILNLDQRNVEYQSGNYSLELPLKDWGTHLNSWTGQNVMESFNGLVVNFDNLIKDPIFALAEIIGHLIQNSIPLELNYEIISEFVAGQNSQITKTPKYELSNAKKKLFKRQFDQNTSIVNFEI